MSWGEAIRLTTVLVTDPSSHVGAALSRFEYPITRTDMVMRDLFDLQHMSKVKKKPQPYPRPWSTNDNKRRIGRTTLSRERVMAVLREHGHFC